MKAVVDDPRCCVQNVYDDQQCRRLATTELAGVWMCQFHVEWIAHSTSFGRPWFTNAVTGEQVNAKVALEQAADNVVRFKR